MKISEIKNNNLSLYIDLTPVCNCDCDFCITKVTFNRKKIKNSVYLDKLNNIFFNLKDKIKTVHVLGGEPLCDSKINNILELVKYYKIPNSNITTNGSLLNDKLIDTINFSSISEINITRNHYDEIKNQEIVKNDNIYTNRKLINDISEIKKPIRIFCNLLKNSINSYKEIIRFIDYCYLTLNITDIKFSNLTILPKEYIFKNEIIDYTEKNIIDYPQLINNLNNNNLFKFIKQYQKIGYCYNQYKYLKFFIPLDIYFMFTDFSYLKEFDNDDHIYNNLYFHTDGTLSGSLNKNKKILEV